MNEPKRRAARHSLTGTGLYIALFLGLTALAVTGYWMLLPSSTDKTPTNVTEPPVTTPITAEPVTPDVPEVKPEEPAEPVQSVVEVTVLEKEPEATEPVTPVAPRLIVSPLSGETVAAFSMDELAYSETLADWRTHDGIDIKADAGTQVLAASSGTVLSVADDDLMGTTVVIAHDGGYETTYSNLQSVPTVAPEQYVSAGQVIGAVGATSLAEASMSPHLHFSVTKDGEIIDPPKRPPHRHTHTAQRPLPFLFLYSLIGKPSADRFTQSASGFVASSKIATASAFGASVNLATR